MILAKRPEVDRFLARPDAGIRAVVIHGKDRSGVAERAEILCKAITPDLNDPFNVSSLTDSDIDGDEARLEEALTALSMIGGRRLVRVRLSGEKASIDKMLAAASRRMATASTTPTPCWSSRPARSGGTRRCGRRRKAGKASAGIAVYEDEAGDIARMTREALAVDKVGLTSDALQTFVARLPKRARPDASGDRATGAVRRSRLGANDRRRGAGSASGRRGRRLPVRRRAAGIRRSAGPGTRQA